MHSRKNKSHRNKQRRRLLRAAALLLPVLLLSALLAQTASAKTYVITDGERVFTYTTSETDPVQVLDEAGLELSELDSYTTGSGSITVRRAQRITVDHLGEVITLETCGETVGQILARLNIILEPEDTITHELNEETYDGMELRIWRVTVREENYCAAIPHEVRYCYDSSLAEGEQAVLVEGQDGELLCTARVTYINGVEESREILNQTVLRGATEAVVAIGSAAEVEVQETADDMPVIGDGFILLPTGEVLTYTGTAQVRATAYTHTDAGCDLITATGSTVHIGTVAVDPRYIPYGTRMFIVANDGSYVYGISEAEDCGGAIKGDRVDLYFPTYQECMEFGWRNCTIYFLG